MESIGAPALREQLERAAISKYGDPADPTLLLAVPEDSPRAAVPFRVPVEGRAWDTDGGVIEFLLHVVDGRLNEFEVIRQDGAQVIAVPSPEAVQVTVSGS